MLELAEIRGGTVRVTSCRDGKLVGRRGVEARVTARAAHLVAERRSETGKRVDVIVAPRKGTKFRLELESFPGISVSENGPLPLWVDIRGENLAGG